MAGEAIHDIANDAQESVSVRTAAVAALGDMCRKESVQLLYKLALRAGYRQLPYDEPLGMAALAALRAIAPRDRGERLAPLLAKDDRVPHLVRSIAKDIITHDGTCR